MNWSGKRVLVTGAGGFIGSHLTERLVEASARVKAFVLYDARGSWGWLDESPSRKDIEVISSDICDRDCVLNATRDVQVVFHLAALIGIPYSYDAPFSYVRTNAEGTLNVLQAARATGVERVVHTSTSEVYGTAQYVPIDENHPLQGQSPYAASKIAADKLAESYHLSFNLPVVTVRPFNTFGPRQSARAVIPTIITQCLTGDTVRLGNLKPTRDLSYVTDIVDGFLLAASAADVVGRTINLGSGREISIEELAQVIIRLVGRPVQIVCDPERVRPDKSEVGRLLADTSLARKSLGFEPKVTLEEGLGLTIPWVQQHLQKYRPGDYVL